jgi:hypothetical protein
MASLGKMLSFYAVLGHFASRFPSIFPPDGKEVFTRASIISNEGIAIHFHVEMNRRPLSGQHDIPDVLILDLLPYQIGLVLG